MGGVPTDSPAGRKAVGSAPLRRVCAHIRCIIQKHILLLALHPPLLYAISNICNTLMREAVPQI